MFLWAVILNKLINLVFSSQFSWPLKRRDGWEKSIECPIFRKHGCKPFRQQSQFEQVTKKKSTDLDVD